MMVSKDTSLENDDHNQRNLKGPGVLIRTVRKGDMNRSRGKHGDTVRVSNPTFVVQTDESLTTSPFTFVEQPQRSI